MIYVCKDAKDAAIIPDICAVYMHNIQNIRETWLILFTTPIYVVVIGLEMFLSHWQQKRLYTVKDTVENIYLTLSNMGLDLLFRAVSLSVLAFAGQFAFGSIHTAWLYWIALVIGEDFMFYWLHRIDHYCRFFWATHVTHHSCEKLNLTVGFRSSVFEPLYRFIYFIPLALCGFKAIDIVFIYSATQIWGILVHTEYVKSLGPLEWILTTPSHHRVHHASNTLYLDKNLGMLLIIWDRMFGTFQKELPANTYEPIRYGLTTNLTSHHPLHVIFHEWVAIVKDLRRAPNAHAAYMYIFGPPGWSHDGSRHTSAQLRKAYFDKKHDL